MNTVRQALADARNRLAAVADADPELDAQVLLAHLLGRERSWLYAWPDAELGTEQLSAYHALVARRAAGEPVAHITGLREFWGLQLAVTPDTLIPRPDTELLVETALELGEVDQPLDVLDLGTGTGAIALALAVERPSWRISATDMSQGALALARDNATRLGLDRVRFLAGHWFAAVVPGGCFDIILSNPPYIPEDDPHLEQGDVRFEPRSALTAGRDGLDDLRSIISQAPAHLKQGGWLLVEHGFEQGPQARQLFRQADFREILTRRDLAGHERVTLGRI